MSPFVISICSGSGESAHCSRATRCASSSKKCTVSGRCFHGLSEHIAITSLVLFTTDELLSLTPSAAAVSRTARLSRGFCHAHSNCSACTLLGKPCTTRSIEHGRRRRVYFAPDASTPLCCRMRRGGSTVNPTYVRPRIAGLRDPTR